MKEHFEMEANTNNEITDSVTGEGKVAQLLSHRFHSPRESSARRII